MQINAIYFKAKYLNKTYLSFRFVFISIIVIHSTLHDSKSPIEPAFMFYPPHIALKSFNFLDVARIKPSNLRIH